MRPRLSLLPVLLFSAVCAYGQDGCLNPPEKLVIHGRILAPGVKWDSYHEILQLIETQLVGVGYTKTEGEYSMPEQPRGRYYLIVRLDGFKEYRERVDLEGCDRFFTWFIYPEPDEPPIPQVILDFTGEVKEVVDVAELRRQLPAKTVREFEEARKERLRGEREAGQRRLEKLLKLEPTFYDAHNALGSIYLEQKKFREAEAEFNKARELRPGSAAPLVSLGSLYIQEAEASLHPEPGIAAAIVVGDNLGVILDDARSVLEQAIKVKPDAAFAYYLLGLANMRDNRYAKAEENFRKSIGLEPQLRWAHLALANMFIRRNEWQKAVTEFDEYLEKFKKVANRGEVEEMREKVVGLMESTKK